METRSHVLERTRRSPSISVEEVLAELGSPAHYARQFLPDDDPAPRPERPVVLHGLARLTDGGWTRVPLLLLVLAAYAVAVVAFVLGVWKLVEPNATGLWVNDLGGGRRTVELVASDPNRKGREVLGYWLVAIALSISIAIHLAMSALLRRLLRDDARRR